MGNEGGAVAGVHADVGRRLRVLHHCRHFPRRRAPAPPPRQEQHRLRQSAPISSPPPIVGELLISGRPALVQASLPPLRSSQARRSTRPSLCTLLLCAPLQPACRPLPPIRPLNRWTSHHLREILMT